MERKRRRVMIVAGALLLGAIVLILFIPVFPSSRSTLIVNAVIVDGSGGPALAGSIRIEGDKIVAVGEVEERPRDAVMDAGG